MNDLTTLLQDTFAERAETVPVPAPDLDRLRAQVRRRRLTRGSAAGLTAAAAVLLAIAGARMLPADPVEAPIGLAPDARSVVLPSETAYVLAGGRVLALTPGGQAVDLGMRAEALVGWTTEFVLAVDTESRLVRFDAVPVPEKTGRYTFRRVESPVAEPVQSVALSGDGRWLGWIGLDGRARLRDLKAGTTSEPVAVGPNAYLSSVGAEGLLVSGDGELVVRGAGGVVAVPTAADGYGWVSDLARGRVSVADRDSVTRLYDIDGDVATAIAEVPGTGRLAPDGSAVVSVDDSEATQPQVVLWQDGRLRILQEGLQGQAQSVGWLDERTVLVTARVEEGTAVQACAVAARTCGLLMVSRDDVRLAE